MLELREMADTHSFNDTHELSLTVETTQLTSDERCTIQIAQFDIAKCLCFVKGDLIIGVDAPSKHLQRRHCGYDRNML